MTDLVALMYVGRGDLEYWESELAALERTYQKRKEAFWSYNHDGSRDHEIAELIEMNEQIQKLKTEIEWRRRNAYN